MTVTSIDEELIARATEVLARSGDGLRHTVAAALRTRDGMTYAGVNVYALGGGSHAEMTAVAMAISDGHPDVELIVAVGDDGRGVVTACGQCRQMLVDYAPDAEMILPWEGEVQRVPVRRLLPNAFPWVP